MPDAHLVAVVTRATSLLVDLAGGIFTLVIVFGAIRFMTAPSPRAVDSAKSLMGRAALGLLLILLVDVLRNLLTYIAS